MRDNYEAMVVYCRKQYLDFKQGIETRRKKEELEMEDELKRLEDEKLSDAYSSQKNNTDNNQVSKVDKKRK